MAEDFEAWNSFEPISENDKVLVGTIIPQEDTSVAKLPEIPHSDTDKSVLLRSMLPIIPLPGIIQPSLERKRRSPEEYQNKPVLRVPAYLAGLENKVGITPDLPRLDPNNVIWKENVDEVKEKRKVERVITKQLDMEEPSDESNTILNNLVHFMDDDLEFLMDSLEASDDPVVMYMNNRVDDIMHGVHAGMEHPGNLT